MPEIKQAKGIQTTSYFQSEYEMLKYFLADLLDLYIKFEFLSNEVLDKFIIDLPRTLIPRETVNSTMTSMSSMSSVSPSRLTQELQELAEASKANKNKSKDYQNEETGFSAQTELSIALPNERLNLESIPSEDAIKVLWALLDNLSLFYPLFRDILIQHLQTISSRVHQGCTRHKLEFQDTKIKTFFGLPAPQIKSSPILEHEDEYAGCEVGEDGSEVFLLQRSLSG